jgi:hypothetical protein
LRRNREHFRTILYLSVSENKPQSDSRDSLSHGVQCESEHRRSIVPRIGNCKSGQRTNLHYGFCARRSVYAGVFCVRPHRKGEGMVDDFQRSPSCDRLPQLAASFQRHSAILLDRRREPKVPRRQCGFLAYCAAARNREDERSTAAGALEVSHADVASAQWHIPIGRFGKHGRRTGLAAGDRGPADRTYHGWSGRPLKTGTFYSAGNRSFLLCLDTVRICTRSLGPQSFDGIDGRRAPRRQKTGEQCRRPEDARDCRDRRYVPGAHAKQHAAHQVRSGNR